MITINPEPEGHLLQRGDIMAWCDGISVEQWRKIQPHLTVVKLPGCAKNYYAKSDVKRKLVEPLSQEL